MTIAILAKAAALSLAISCQLGVSVRFVNGVGVPVADAEIRVRSGTSDRQCRSDAQGGLIVEGEGLHLFDAALGEGSLRGVKRVFKDGSPQEVILLPASAGLRVELMEQDGSPIRGGDLSCALSLGGARIDPRRSRTDGKGIVQMNGLFSGNYLVTWYVDGGGLVAREIAVSGSVSVEMGRTRRKSNLTVVLPEGKGRYQLLFYGTEETVVTPLMTAGTRFRCNGWIVPGDYLLIVRQEDADRQSAFAIKAEEQASVLDVALGKGSVLVAATCRERAYIMFYHESMRARPLRLESFVGEFEMSFEGLTPGVYDCLLVPERIVGWELDREGVLAFDDTKYVKIRIAGETEPVRIELGEK